MSNPESPDELRQLADEATNMARAAYRDTTRLIRLLAAVGGSSSPEVLMGDMLAVLSEVFGADVTLVARPRAGRLLVAQACGLADNDPAWTEGWPLDEHSEKLLARPGTAATSGLPPVLAEVRAESATWATMSGESGNELVIVCRSDGRPFTLMDRQVVLSVTDRLRSALDVARHAGAMERLAQSSHRLVRQLDLWVLLDEGVTELRGLCSADDAWLLTVDPDGRPGELRTGSGAHRVDPAADPVGWSENVERAAPFEYRDGELHVMSLPILRGEKPVAVLYASRSGQPFSPSISGIAAIFAGNLGAAMENAELYRALGDSERSLRTITDSISDMVAVVDADGRIRYASPSYRRGLGIEPDRLVGSDLSGRVHTDDAAAVRSAVADTVRSLDGTGDIKVEYRLAGADGWFWVESAFRQPLDEGDSAVVSTRVIDDRKRLETELLRRATHDPLTGLANRALIAQTLTDALARTDLGSAVGLLFCDLDKFKTINDRLGHESGDSLLAQVAYRLGSIVGTGDLLGRFGGDEFVVVLAEVADLTEVTRTARRAAQALEDPFLLNGELVRVTSSIGGVVGVRGQSTVSVMMRDADAAMYAAKARGSGLIEVFDDDASHRSLDLLDLRFELAFALERRQLKVQYQPICDLATGELLGFEALARWHHPLRGNVPPGVFIPLAEESGAILEIGAWVLDQACAQLARWQQLPGGAGLRMNVNISPAQLDDRRRAQQLLGTIATYGVDPSDVCLEVTEYNYVRAAATESANELRAAGVRFALDDFGTSYASMSRLKLFPIGTIKIDRGFVAGMVTDAVDRSVVVGVLAIGESLRLSVVAEGVETVQQQQALLGLGCRQAQGYLFAPPLDPDGAEQAVLRGRCGAGVANPVGG
ncbi:putative bifunctional diguanylate cyclase/phosphodiesterase [Skermania piniformis]|uniref:GGDEF domain-containing protein n=1 Tax=Skermania pinensis TaxID=39122 RepID=A0ABX8S4B2_9ACTN|nr:EAL domain-containing protein [Skermania piniformis]QXQ12678.1 GGDEF domain-containing protein [Skermania piniformis]